MFIINCVGAEQKLNLYGITYEGTTSIRKGPTPHDSAIHYTYLLAQVGATEEKFNWKRTFVSDICPGNLL